MKKIVCLIISVMLVFCMALSFSACQNNAVDKSAAESSVNNSTDTSAEKGEEKTEKTTEKKAENKTEEKTQEDFTENSSIIGTWKANIDVTSAVTDAIDSVNATMKDYMDIGKISADYTLIFNKDGTYTATLDKDAFRKQIKKVEESLLPAHRKYLENIIKIHGLDTTVEDYLLENDDMTLEEETALFIERCDFAKLMIENSGYYKYEDGKLSFASVADSFGGNYYTVNLGEKSLVLKEFSKQKYGTVDISKLLPIEFKK